ncbi:MAG: S8 family serine peptidase, partial [Thermoplasmata archaeon]
MVALRKAGVYLVTAAILLSFSASGEFLEYEGEEEVYEERVSVIVQLEGQPTLPYKAQLNDGYGSEYALLSYSRELKSQHEEVRKKLESAIPRIEFRRDYTSLFNGMAIELPKEHLDDLSEFPGIIGVHEDGPVYPHLSDTVPLIKADYVWLEENETGHSITGKDVLVSVIDSGIDYTHPALGGGFGPGFRVIGGWDYINNDSDPIDDWWHGTHVAGIIGANGTKVGVAPDVEFLAYKVFDAGGGGGSWSNVITAIESSADPDGDPGTDDGADIISMSLSGAGGPDSPVCQAVDNDFASGILSVASAGNEGPANRTVGAPANARSAVAVGSVTKEDKLFDYSSRGPSSILGIKPNILAPGVNVESTKPGGGYSSRTGTSMAAPHVSGTAALVIQAHGDWDQNITRATMVNTAIDKGSFVNWQGSGRVDAYEAVKAEAVIVPDSLSLGIVDIKNDMWYREEELRIVSTSDSLASYDLTVSMASYTGVTVSLNTSTVPLLSKGSGYFTLNVTLDNTQAEEHWFEGKIIANTTTENLSVPFFFVKENLTVLATPNPSNGQTRIKIFSPVAINPPTVKVKHPDETSEVLPVGGSGREWTSLLTVSQNGVHIINASSTDGDGNSNFGWTLLVGDLIPPDFNVTASPDPADYLAYINITSNEDISGVWFPDERITPRDGLESMYPEITCDSNDNLQMVWVDDEGDTRNSIFYMRFDGDAWQNKTIISDTGGHGASDAKLAVDLNDQVHSIFHESIGNWYGRMYYCKIDGRNGSVVIPYKNITAATHFIQDEQSVSDMA